MLGSVVFYILSFLFTAAISVFSVPLLFSRSASMQVMRVFGTVELWLLELCCNIRVKHNIKLQPTGEVIACKHQSVLEILILLKHVPNPVFFMKKELLFIPFVNLYLIRTGQLFVNRGKGNNSHLIGKAVQRLSDSNIIIFPEGTRVGVDADAQYHAGVVLLAQQAEVSVVPMAVNSGLFWSRRTLAKRSGVATLKQLPRFYPAGGLKGNIAELKGLIDSESAKLCKKP